MENFFYFYFGQNEANIKSNETDYEFLVNKANSRVIALIADQFDDWIYFWVGKVFDQDKITAFSDLVKVYLRFYTYGYVFFARGDS